MRVALDAGVIGLDGIHARGIENVSPSGVLDVFAAGAVAALAADVPFGNLFGVDVIADGVAAIAGGAGGALHVVWWIERLPPIRAFGDEIRTPHFMGDVPLSGLGKIVVADFREVTLLPETPIDERDLIPRELGNFIGREVRDDGVRKFARIANNVGHGRFVPVFINLRVTFLAGGGAGVVSGGDGGYLSGALFGG